MLIYVDPQCYTNHFVKDITLANLPESVEITSDLERLPELDIYVAGYGVVTREMIEKATNLKTIVRNAVGMDNIDREAAKQHGIAVYNLPYVNFQSVAELTIGLFISCGRHVVFNHVQNTKGIAQNYYVDYQGIELTGKTFGIVGFGTIGKKVAAVEQNGFDGKVLVYDKFVPAEVCQQYGVEKVDDLNEFMSRCDFISVHVPLTPETKDLINAEQLAHCKPQCIIVNIARYGVVNEEALYNALKNHQIFAAADDVLETELGNPLFELDNFIGTSHVGGNSQEARRNVGVHLLERLQSEIKKIEEAK